MEATYKWLETSDEAWHIRLFSTLEDALAQAYADFETDDRIPEHILYDGQAFDHQDIWRRWRDWHAEQREARFKQQSRVYYLIIWPLAVGFWLVLEWLQVTLWLEAVLVIACTLLMAQVTLRIARRVAEGQRDEVRL